MTHDETRREKLKASDAAQAAAEKEKLRQCGAEYVDALRKAFPTKTDPELLQELAEHYIGLHLKLAAEKDACRRLADERDMARRALAQRQALPEPRKLTITDAGPQPRVLTREEHNRLFPPRRMEPRA